jgi:hypothetical protein
LPGSYRYKLMKYPRLDIARRVGDEPFVASGKPVGATLLGFWQWSSSDLIDNATRGRLAEYLVAVALDQAHRARGTWDSFDIESKSGVRVEVKSASPWQTWAQQEPSRLTFGIRPTHGWDADMGTFESGARRQADVYVFAVLSSDTKEELNPLDLDQWRFYVLPTSTLNERLPSQRSISLQALLTLGPVECTFDHLSDEIERAGKQPN